MVAKGINNSPFEKGVQSDTIRQIQGELINNSSNRAGGFVSIDTYSSGCFRGGSPNRGEMGSSTAMVGQGIIFDASKTVPTALQNNPINVSGILWRRIT